MFVLEKLTIYKNLNFLQTKINTTYDRALMQINMYKKAKKKGLVKDLTTEKLI